MHLQQGYENIDANEDSITTQIGGILLSSFMRRGRQTFVTHIGRFFHEW